MRLLLSSFLAATLLVACTPTPVSESAVCANGFAPTGKPVTMGSESSVDLVKAIDVEWAKLDLEAMRRFYSDTCRYEWNDGDQFQGFEPSPLAGQGYPRLLLDDELGFRRGR